ncbi:P1 family peptidase [Nocardioides panaciterrulae]|uniref:D-aminopeptidase n=1 Tax=Nocardioides panaciterrulae TaxID=661492 RepID=A0A7Y9JAF8_9ACTN|nr:P1 family peptidase [Nocardioides panaciterrulae]NYD41647.1 D-aminopeptidase [Nocardioides panaciterrulae]
MPRARELGIVIGAMPTGPTNSVLDVPGVGLGHTTVHRDEPAPPEGRGVARTGVSVLVLAEDAYRRPVPAGGAVLNGAGECTGFLTAGEWGSAETPVYLTSTMQLGRVYDAACEIALEAHPEVADDVVIPVVAECDDSHLNDCRRMQVTGDDVRAAHAAALASRGSAEPPEQGAVGAGTGMSCFGFKGGIGTASRTVGDHTVAVLLLTNFGVREELVVAGTPVGRQLPPVVSGPAKPAGSCIGLVVTDAPVDGAACARLARRVGLGLARSGSVAHHGSGEIFLGFGTGLRLDRDGTPDRTALGGRALDPLFAGVVEAAEEAVLDSMFTSPTTVGRDGHTSESLHSPGVLALLRR